MNGAETVVKFLQDKGVTCGFGYPGGPVLVLYEAIYKLKFNHILTRHEQGAVHAAEGYAKATGKPGVVFATSGPGATNLVTGLADAKLDSVPLLAITGAVARDDTGSDAFQEADITCVTEPVTKYNYFIMDESELLPALEEAWEMTTSDRPGPVLINIPKDILATSIPADHNATNKVRRHRPQPPESETQIPAVLEALSQSEKPLMLVGGGCNISPSAPAALKGIVDAIGLPCATTLMGKGTLAADQRHYLGHIGMHGTVQSNHALAECDLLLIVGSRLSDRVVALPDDMRAAVRTIIHVDIDGSEVGKRIRPDIPIEADAGKFLSGLLDAVTNNGWRAPEVWQSWRDMLEDLTIRFNRLITKRLAATDPLRASFIIDRASHLFAGQDPLVVTDVGQHQMFAAQYFKIESPNSFLTSGGLGTMGFGLPAAIGGSYGCPERPTVLVAGDGGLQMTIQELGLLAALDLPVFIMIMDNSTLGMVRQWQTLFFDEHYSQSMLGNNPDFVKIAEAYDITGKNIHTVEEFDAAVSDFQANPRPYLTRIYVETFENVFPMIPAGKGPGDLIMPGFEA
ncbi:MAG: biosynthetic-type acetolactate synthase large subunit [Fastidiosipilaceae bacterium]|nr:biosynthetic-type acetolactate synthase large subunit [Clostridiaceae bacterium]